MIARVAIGCTVKPQNKKYADGLEKRKKSIIISHRRIGEFKIMVHFDPFDASGPALRREGRNDNLHFTLYRYFGPHPFLKGG